MSLVNIEAKILLKILGCRIQESIKKIKIKNTISGMQGWLDSLTTTTKDESLSQQDAGH